MNATSSAVKEPIVVQMLSENGHLKRAFVYISILAEKYKTVLDLRYNCKNISDFKAVVDFCNNTVDRELDESDVSRLTALSRSLYESSIVNKVSGFSAFEPSVEAMQEIKILFMTPDTYLGKIDSALMPISTQDLIVEFTFCTDTKEDLALMPGEQFDLFGMLNDTDCMEHEGTFGVNKKNRGKGKK